MLTFYGACTNMTLAVLWLINSKIAENLDDMTFYRIPLEDNDDSLELQKNKTWIAAIRRDNCSVAYDAHFTR